MALVVIAHLFPHPDRVAAAIDVISATVPLVHEEPGCGRYALHQDSEGTDLWMVERWADRAAFDAHLAGNTFRTMAQELRPLCERPAELVVLAPQVAGDPDQGAV